MALAEARSRRVPLPFVGQAYESSSLTISAQEAVNCYVEIAQGATNPTSLRGVPGATRFTDLRDLRGLHVAFGTLYAVAGNEVYSVSKMGRASFIGNVSDDGLPAGMAHNIFDVTVVSAGQWYNINRSTGVISQIATPPVSHPNFLDGYVLAVEKNSGRFIWSNINASGTVDGADFATAEGSPDQTLALVVDHREIFLFGERSIERWYNDGVSPFIRMPNGYSERGCGAAHSPAKLDNTVFWLGDDFIVYRLTDGRPQRVSNHGIEQLIQRTLDPTTAVGLSYSQDGHAFYQLTFPGGLTVTYDAASQAWHTRKLFGRGDCGYQHHAYVYGNHYVGGDYLWKFDDSAEFEGPLERVRTIGPVRTGRRFASMYSMGLLFETGSNASYVDPQKIFLEVSHDGGRTFSNRRQAQVGLKGQYSEEVVFHGLGGLWDNQRVMRLTLTDAAKFNLVEAWAEVG